MRIRRGFHMGGGLVRLGWRRTVRIPQWRPVSEDSMLIRVVRARCVRCARRQSRGARRTAVRCRADRMAGAPSRAFSGIGPPCITVASVAEIWRTPFAHSRMLRFASVSCLFPASAFVRCLVAIAGPQSRMAASSRMRDSSWRLSVVRASRQVEPMTEVFGERIAKVPARQGVPPRGQTDDRGSPLESDWQAHRKPHAQRSLDRQEHR